MKFTGAIVKTEGKNIAVAVVADSFLTLPQAEKMAEMRRYASAFPGLPLVFMTMAEDGESEFFGRPDLIALLSDVPLNYIIFKTFETKE